MLIKALDNRFYVKFMQLEIGLLNYEMICYAKSLAEEIFFIKNPISILVSIGSPNNPGTCSLGHWRVFSS